MSREAKRVKCIPFLRRAFSWLLLVFVGLLLLLNVLITARAWGNNGEDELTIRLQSPLVVLLSILFIFLCSKLSQKIATTKPKHLLFSYLFFATLLAILFYAFWNPVLNADSGDLYGYILDKQKDPLYIQTWPVNLGYLGVMLFSHLVFSDDIFGLFIINLGAFYLAVISIFQITKILFNKDSILRNFVILLACFFPIYFEIIFFYNDMLGMAFAFFGVWQALLLRRKNKLINFLLLAVSIVVMLAIRQNTLIILTAILFFLVFTTKKKNLLYTIASIAISAIVFFYSPAVLQSLFSKIYGWDFSDTSKQDPTISWIAMGMLDEADEKLNVEPKQANIAGWWNGYNRSCVIELGDKCSEYSSETINRQLRRFISNPARGVSFYFKKIASQWAEPSFQTPFFMSHCETDNSTAPRRFLCKASTHTLSFVNNLVHLALLVLSFIAVYSLRKSRKMTWQKILLLLAVSGYFAFSILWEAKSRYILLVFPLLIPFAAYGLELVPNITKRIKSKAERKR